MVENERYKQIKALPLVQSHLLCFLAYVGEPTTERIIDRYGLREGVSRAEQQAILKQLVKGGLCGEYRTLRDQLFSVQPAYMFQALKFMYVEHPEWDKSFDSYNLFRMTKYGTLQNAIKRALKGESVPQKGTLGIYEGQEFMMAFTELALDPDFAPVINIVSPNAFNTLIECIISFIFWYNYDFDANALIKAVTIYDLLDEDAKKETYALIALYHYYYNGTYNPIEKGTSVFDYLLKAVRSIHKEQYNEALNNFNLALAKQGRYGKSKDVFAQPLNNHFLVSTYIRIDSAETMQKLEQLTKKKNLERNVGMLSALIIANRHICESKPKLLQLIHKSSKGTDILQILGKCMAALVEDDSDDMKWADVYPRFAIVRHEFQDFLQLSDEDKNILNSIYGTPAYAAGKIRQKWEIVLDRINQLSLLPEQTTTAQEKLPPMERLIYIVEFDHVKVMLQKQLKNCSWSVPKEVVKYRYEQRDYECMDNTDMKLCKIMYGDYYIPSIDNCMPLLVGSDKVFLRQGSTLVPVTIKEEKAYVILDEKGNSFAFSSNLSKVVEGKTQYVVKHSDTLYSVVTITPQQSTLLANLLKIKKLPAEAEEALKKTISHVARRIEVHSPLLGEDHSLPAVEGSTKTIVQVKPLDPTSYFVTLMAKPLPDGNDYIIPGSGNRTIICEIADKRCKVVRKLNEEKKLAKELFDYIIANCCDEDSEMEYYADGYTPCKGHLSPEALLKTMEYVMNHADKCELEWPKGGKIKLLPQPTKWEVGMHRAGGWFEIEGNVTIDEERVVSIAELLQLATNFGDNQFIRLSDTEYIMLSEAIRKQLSRLEAISQKSSGSVVVPINNASLLSEAMTGDIKIGNQEELHEICTKIENSYKLKPEPPKQLNATLRNYQLDGFRWMAQLDSWGAGACLADDMGLGKTVQTIAMLIYKSKEGASLVVAPTSVVSNWENELHKFAPKLNVTLLNAADDRKSVVSKAKANDVILTTYGILSNDTDSIGKKEWNVVCLDEAHTIKNRETKMAHAVHSLNAKTKIALTGTPLQNHLGELWSLFNFINPGLLGTYEMFRQKFVNPIESQNKTRQEQLRRIVLPFMLRRTKQEVAKELPDKTETIRTVELSNDEMNVYELIRRDAKKKLEEEGKVSVSVLAEITKLRQAACAASLANPNLTFKSSKIEQLLQIVDNIGEEGNRILIFSQFTSFLKMVKKAFDKEKISYLYLDGTTTLKQREKLVKQFQKGEGRIFIISLKAGGLGLNLTGANYVIHMDPWWNPAIEQQATDRAYRIGQKQNVTVYHLISAHTIEEKILRLHQSKRDLAESLLEGANVSHKITEEDLNQLLT